MGHYLIRNVNEKQIDRERIRAENETAKKKKKKKASNQHYNQLVPSHNPSIVPRVDELEIVPKMRDRY